MLSLIQVYAGGTAQAGSAQWWEQGVSWREVARASGEMKKAYFTQKMMGNSLKGFKKGHDMARFAF